MHKNSKQIIDKAINNLQNRLLQIQEDDGSFGQITFFTSLVLNFLDKLTDSPSIKNLKNKACNFLISNKSTGWSWNYYSKMHAEKGMDFNQTPILPDDFDDTCRATLGLKSNDKDIPVEAWAKFINDLLNNEQKIGGPYSTWLNYKVLKGKEIWEDIDPVVNSVIAETLSIIQTETQQLTTYLENVLVKYHLTGKFESKYYHQPVFFLWSMSRWYTGEKLNILIKCLKNEFIKIDPLIFGVVANTADTLPKENLKNDNYLFWKCLITSSLIKLGKVDDIPEKFIIDICKQKLEGIQPAPTELYIEKIYFDKNNTEVFECAKSEAVEISALLETLYLYRLNMSKRESIHRNIISSVISDLQISDNGTDVSEIIRKILKNDPEKSITLMAYDLVMKFSNRKPQKRDIRKCLTLGKASLHGWIASRIFDDYTDGHKTKHPLPLARIAESFSRKYFNNPLYDKYLNEMIISDLMEKNISENNNLNLDSIPNSGFESESEFEPKPENKIATQNKSILFRKSIGHSLSAVLICKHLKAPHFIIDEIKVFFKNYLVARQLCDDAHDIKSENETNVFQNLTNNIEKYINAAKRSIKDERILHLEKLLFPLINGIKNARSEKANNRKFFEAYYPKNYNTNTDSTQIKHTL